MLKDEGARAEVAKFKAQLDEWRKLDVDFQMVPEGPHTGFKDKTDLAFHFELGHPDLNKKTVISLDLPARQECSHLISNGVTLKPRLEPTETLPGYQGDFIRLVTKEKESSKRSKKATTATKTAEQIEFVGMCLPTCAHCNTTYHMYACISLWST